LKKLTYKNATQIKSRSNQLVLSQPKEDSLCEAKMLKKIFVLYCPGFQRLFQVKIFSILTWNSYASKKCKSSVI